MYIIHITYNYDVYLTVGLHPFSTSTSISLVGPTKKNIILETSIILSPCLWWVSMCQGPCLTYKGRRKRRRCVNGKPMGKRNRWICFEPSIDMTRSVTFVDGYVETFWTCPNSKIFGIKGVRMQEWNPSVCYFLQKAIFLVYMETNMWKNQDISKSAIFFPYFHFYLAETFVTFLIQINLIFGSKFGPSFILF